MNDPEGSHDRANAQLTIDGRQVEVRRGRRAGRGAAAGNRHADAVLSGRLSAFDVVPGLSGQAGRQRPLRALVRDAGQRGDAGGERDARGACVCGARPGVAAQRSRGRLPGPLLLRVPGSHGRAADAARDRRSGSARRHRHDQAGHRACPPCWGGCVPNRVRKAAAAAVPTVRSKSASLKCGCGRPRSGLGRSLRPHLPARFRQTRGRVGAGPTGLGRRLPSALRRTRGHPVRSRASGRRAVASRVPRPVARATLDGEIAVSSSDGHRSALRPDGSDADLSLDKCAIASMPCWWPSAAAAKSEAAAWGLSRHQAAASINSGTFEHRSARGLRRRQCHPRQGDGRPQRRRRQRGRSRHLAVRAGTSRSRRSPGRSRRGSASCRPEEMPEFLAMAEPGPPLQPSATADPLYLPIAVAAGRIAAWPAAASLTAIADWSVTRPSTAPIPRATRAAAAPLCKSTGTAR
jgi:hypothetical protein